MKQRPVPASLLLMGLELFRKFCGCGSPAAALCDWKTPEHRSGTCDEPVCRIHGKEVTPGKYLCLQHQLEYDRAQRKFSASELKALFAEAA
jgi:hypothetical protein